MLPLPVLANAIDMPLSVDLEGIKSMLRAEELGVVAAIGCVLNLCSITAGFLLMLYLWCASWQTTSRSG